MSIQDAHVGSFRLAVDLTSVFDDDRGWCYIYLKPQKFVLINDLEIYLQKVFEIPPPVKLFIGKYFLPSSESIKVIRIGDVVRVVGDGKIFQLAEDSCARTRKKKNYHTKKNSSGPEENEVLVNTSLEGASPCVGAGESLVNGNVNSETHDRVTVEGCSSDVQGDEEQKLVEPEAKGVKKKKKSKRSLQSSNVVTDEAEVVKTNGELVCDPMSLDSIKKAEETDFNAVGESNLNISAEPVPSDGDTDMKVDSFEVPKKRRRTRHRKRKIMLSCSVGQTVSLIRSSVSSLLSQNTEKCSVGKSDHYTNGKHVRFSEDDGDVSTVGDSDRDVPSEDTSPKFNFNRNIPSARVESFSNWDVKASPASAPQTQSFANLLLLRHTAAPVVFERKQAKPKVPELVTSPVVLARDEVTQQKSDAICDSANATVLSEPNIDPKNYPLLTSAPRRHDVILFKALVLTENCVPQLSSYVKATVVDYCPLSCDVKLQIISNGEQLHQLPVKFATEVQTELPENDFTILNWNEIHETRIVSRATEQPTKSF